MKLHPKSVLASVAFAALGLLSTARAQDFNIDLGSDLGSPPATYGAGAAQPGTWNVINSLDDFGPYPDTALMNTAGVLTGVVASCVGGLGGGADNDVGTAVGGDQELMDDYQDVGSPSSPLPGAGSTTWTFTGLANGPYEVYTYAWCPNFGLFSNVSVAGSTSANPQVCGGLWPGVQTLGITYTKHFVVVTTGTISITITEPLHGVGTVNGFQLDQLPLSTTAFCFGDGTGALCPCMNTGTFGRGCKSSKPGAPFGALLSAVNPAGAPNPSVSVTANELGLKCENMMAGSYTVFFQGTAQVNGGLGQLSPFYDGLECVGGAVVRLGRIGTLGGTSTLPGVAGATGLSPVAQTLHYQAAYRNAVHFCTPATLNTSNALTVDWTP